MSDIQKIILVRPRGFCAGVDRAVRTVRECLDIFGAPIYIKHQIVHNTTVSRDLEERGAITVETLEEVPNGSVVVFSAHGSSPEHYREAKRRNLQVIDATCPLVTKVHLEMHRYMKQGYDVVYIGHKGHIEGEGVCAEAREYGKEVPIVENVSDVARLGTLSDMCAYLTQTTLSVFETEEITRALKERFPQIENPPIQDICYATTNRQYAVRELARQVDGVLVVGSTHSSNSNRLAEVVRGEGIQAYLVEDLDGVRLIDFGDMKKIGITAGASAPESSVRSIVEYFVFMGAVEEELEVISESMQFSQPLELQKRNIQGKEKKKDEK